MASIHPNGLSFVPHSVSNPYESDVEAELEVDQLDSDSDPDEQVDPTKLNALKNGLARPGERVLGHTLLPAVRVENMIQADGVTGNLALSKEGLFVLSIATEEFIKSFIQAGHREASAHRRNQINYIDMAATAQQYQEFMFLGDTIPGPVSLADALMLRQEKERELLEDNPAMAPPSPIPSWTPTPLPEPPSKSASVKPAKKSRSTNGKEKLNGSASASSKRNSKKPSHSPYPIEDFPVSSVAISDRMVSPTGTNDLMSEPPQNHRRSARNGTSSLSASTSIPPPSTNGQPSGISRSQTPQCSREDSMEPSSRLPQAHYPETHSHSHSPPYHGQDEAAWPGQFTGPASGFLRGSVVPFGRVPQNPGRTIYSQNHRPD